MSHLTAMLAAPMSFNGRGLRGSGQRYLCLRVALGERVEPCRTLPELLDSFRAERLLSENVTNLAFQRTVIGLCLRLQRGDDLFVDVPNRYVRHGSAPVLRAL